MHAVGDIGASSLITCRIAYVFKMKRNANCTHCMFPFLNVIGKNMHALGELPSNDTLNADYNVLNRIYK